MTHFDHAIPIAIMTRAIAERPAANGLIVQPRLEDKHPRIQTKHASDARAAFRGSTAP